VISFVSRKTVLTFYRVIVEYVRTQTHIFLAEASIEIEQQANFVRLTHPAAYAPLWPPFP